MLASLAICNARADHHDSHNQCTDQFMKIVGLRYLSETIKPVIDEIFREKKDCELDPTKV